MRIPGTEHTNSRPGPVTTLRCECKNELEALPEGVALMIDPFAPGELVAVKRTCSACKRVTKFRARQASDG